jgi:hypothetical protein
MNRARPEAATPEAPAISAGAARRYFFAFIDPCGVKLSVPA